MAIRKSYEQFGNEYVEPSKPILSNKRKREKYYSVPDQKPPLDIKKLKKK